MRDSHSDSPGAPARATRNRRSPWAVRGGLPRSSALALALLGFLLPFIAWTALSTSGWVDPVFLPTPMKVLLCVRDWLLVDNLLGDIGVSMGRVFGGFLLSAAVALPLGVTLGAYAPVRALLQPLTDFSRYLPAVAFIPLIMLWVGIDESAKVAVVVVGAFCQMVLLIADDIARVPDAPIEAAKTMGATDGEVVQHVLIPAARPAMLDTLRSMMGLCWTYLVVAELVAANSGLGYSILKAQRFLQTDKIFAGILLIGLVGLLTDQAFRWLHRRAFPWHHLRS
ncbi:ABC transporter permease [Pseudoduganella namucuonensis]|uniref:NitT/TauT family transport system permease protein n=1 Tax=Pseudoduganella namucuonensis TaxID=1035707 RepID=A0A1I7LA47_9BURK|nr:ABC transporter permease [Pseudoduganella namucuonensis]SFV06508.1 NitT/TauT family transport system permease protein [Pseudoduganella namucuonensis]